MNNYISKIFIIFLFYYLKINNYKFKNKISNNKNINRRLDYSEQLKIIKKMKKVVYTVIFGNYDTIKEFNKQKGYDYYLFTDNITIINKTKSNWTLVPIPDEIKKLKISNVRKQRYLKLHPHLYFSHYNLSIYIDACFIIKGELDEFLLRIFSPKYYLFTLEHPNRSSIYKEIEKVSSLQKDKTEITNRVYKRYIKENFTNNSGLIESCLLIRKHNEPDCINFMKEWYEEIKKYSHRDQLSFNYIKCKKNITMKYISKMFALKYFNRTSNHLIKIKYKY